ncbi:metal tolerance protein C4 [Capsicum galapagoense]
MGVASEGMKVKEYIWRGHDPTAVVVMTEDSWLSSIVVGNLLGMVAVFLIQRTKHALIETAIDDKELEKIVKFLKNDPVVDSVYDCKSDVIGLDFFRFKTEIGLLREQLKTMLFLLSLPLNRVILKW